MASADLTVMGAGVFGLSVAWEALRRGASVRVIEVARVGAGASGGLVGALAPHAPDPWDDGKAFQAESLLLAPGFWAEVAAAGGIDPGYAPVGRLVPLADAHAVARARVRAGLGADHWAGGGWHVVEATGAPWEPVSPGGYLAYDTLSARVDPRRGLSALAAAVRSLGGTVELGTAEPGPGQVVWATGAAGLADLSRSLGQMIGRGEKGQAARLQASPPPGAALVQGRGLWVVPHADGTVAIGSTSESAWDDPSSTDAQLDAIIARARALVPALASAPVVERWAGIRPRSASRQLLIDAWPGRPGHYVVNGGFKTGFGLAPLAARLVVDLALDGCDAVPAWARLQSILSPAASSAG